MQCKLQIADCATERLNADLALILMGVPMVVLTQTGHQLLALRFLVCTFVHISFVKERLGLRKVWYAR